MRPFFVPILGASIIAIWTSEAFSGQCDDIYPSCLSYIDGNRSTCDATCEGFYPSADPNKSSKI
jgi:hypothetical protein